MSASLRVFLDTNILIDLLDAERPQHAASTELMRAINERLLKVVERSGA
jgi:predicted nucleic acid-binding protein